MSWHFAVLMASDWSTRLQLVWSTGYCLNPNNGKVCLVDTVPIIGKLALRLSPDANSWRFGRVDLFQIAHLHFPLLLDRQFVRK